MRKVENLKEILNKLAGENVASDSDQTVCDVLSKMEKYIGQSGSGTIQTTQTTYDKWAVVVVAGQSNAVGYDESAPSSIFDVSRDNNRIKQLGYKDEHNLELVDLCYCAENFQDMSKLGYKNQGTKGMHLPLANLLLDYIPNDYGLLVLPCAYGGTAFGTGGNYDQTNMKVPASGGVWGAQANQYYAMRDRLKKVLDMNEENVLLGVVWVQGEFGGNNPTNNNNGFDSMTEQFFNDFAAYRSRTRRGVMDKSIWFNVETTVYWYSQENSTSAGVKNIWEHYKVWNPDTYVEIPRDPNITNYIRNVPDGTAWTGTATSSLVKSHFGNNANATVLAPRILRKMLDNGCLFYSGVHDSDTQADIQTLEKTVENLNSDIELLYQALEEASINVPERERWVDATEDLVTRIYNNNAVIEGNNYTMNMDSSGVLLPENIKKFRFTDQTETNKILYLICGVNEVTENGDVTAQALYVDFDSQVQNKWIDLGNGKNRLTGSTNNGHSKAEINNFFTNGGKNTYEAEYVENTKTLTFTRISDDATITFDLNILTTSNVRFGFATFTGNNYGPAKVTNVQFVQ